MSARPDLAFQLLQIPTPATSNSLCYQTGLDANSEPLVEIPKNGIWSVSFGNILVPVRMFPNVFAINEDKLNDKSMLSVNFMHFFSCYVKE